MKYHLICAVVFSVVLIYGCENQHYDSKGCKIGGYDRDGHTIGDYDKNGCNDSEKYNLEYDKRLKTLLKKIQDVDASSQEINGGIDKDNSEVKVHALGTGFLLSEKGWVVTNYHVVDKQSEIQVFFPKPNKSFDGTLILKDIHNDLAIIELKNFVYEDLFSGKIPYAVRRSSSVKLSESTFLLGFPAVPLLGTQPKFSSGAISSVYGFHDTAALFQISNPTQPGNSGSPLFDKDGNLIGIVESTIDVKYFMRAHDVIPENINFAVKSDYLANLIAMLPDDDEIIERTSILIGKEQHEQVNAIVPYVVIIQKAPEGR